MGLSMVKREFYKWILAFDESSLIETDIKLLNLFIENFEIISTLGTAGGKRAKKVGELIESKNSILGSVLPDLSEQIILNTEIIKSINELKIGPFRGISSEEAFIFDKKYTFMYGPNGSGKSSFCEGMEYALLGSIEEADSKRIDAKTYMKNIQVGSFKKPIIYGLNSENKRIEINKNPSIYQFSFLERNRIENFARINATTLSDQKDRIATLFGLDAFRDFVDGFTDNFGEKYLTLSNKKKEKFSKENQEIEGLKTKLLKIDEELIDEENKIKLLIDELSEEGITNRKEVSIFLSGKDGLSGIINSFQEKKVMNIPEIIDDLIIEVATKKINNTKKVFEELKVNKIKLEKNSSKLNFKDLYSALKSIAREGSSDMSICPACKTPISKGKLNPFDNATLKLSKMNELVNLQGKIKNLSIIIEKSIREINNNIKKINEIKNKIKNGGEPLSTFTELAVIEIETRNDWKIIFEKEFNKINQPLVNNLELLKEIKNYNFSLQEDKKGKEEIDEKLLKYQGIKKIYDEFCILKIRLLKEKRKLKRKNKIFLNQNKLKLLEIEECQKVVDINIEYFHSYQKIIKDLKIYINKLPLTLAEGLSDKAKEFYNIINDHDPNFEKLENLKLPTKAGDKILIQFQSDEKPHDALLILSEGHIKVLGLSLLLAKVVNDDLRFIIFDDVVNAIDDEHRDGIAELLLNNINFKHRQQIITCHGDMFIKKLEQKLGASNTMKEVKNYRFIPSDSIKERGIKISIGNSKHYLLQARKSLDEDDRKDVALRCRQAIESISESLWKKIGNKFNINLTVKMRRPGVRPDLSSVVSSLIKEVKNISELNELKIDLMKLKDNYLWNLLNKGVHEQGDLPELQRKDVSDLLNLVENIEDKVIKIKL